jgi:voltage-gated potassium channel
LGPVLYQGHLGDRPIAITWRLEHAVPAALFDAYATLVSPIETLTTVGYGDMVPKTPPGKFLGSLRALIGIGFFALPAGVLSAAFAEEIGKMKAPRACPHCGQTIDA